MTPKYYNWNQTLSYNAPVTQVISARGTGKTFGLRIVCLEDYLRTGRRSVECVRYQNGLKDFKARYFSRLDRLYSNLEFKVEGKRGYIRHIESNGIKNDWELYMYFEPLSGASKIKVNTYDFVHNIVMDESVLDSGNIHDRYLSNEVLAFADIIDTVTRERGDVDAKDKIVPRAFLLGNALDLLNPYFAHFNVNTVPRPGYTWYNNKTFLLHYYKDEAYGLAKSQNTLAGKILGADGAVSNFGEFRTVDPRWIAQKTPNAVFKIGWYWEGQPFGIWVDSSRLRQHSIWFINDIIPKNQRAFVLASDDHQIDRILLQSNHDYIKHIKKIYEFGFVRFKNEVIADRFLEIFDYVTT